MCKFRVSAVIIAASVMASVSCSKLEAPEENIPGNYRAANANSDPSFTTVFEYTPAPGQFINKDDVEITTAEQAVLFAENSLKGGSMVSLGAFGGYIVVGFDHSIPNGDIVGDSDTGYDFSVKGNPFDNSSEAGIVYVMMDENGNGKPDEVWYELKGAEYGAMGTIKDYEVTYSRPKEGENFVEWSDNQGQVGTIDQLVYHTQATYYPMWIDQDSYTLTGVRLESNLKLGSNGVWTAGDYGWGYADNFGSDLIYPKTSKATNAFKISNAVDKEGSRINLHHIDFIKIQCAINDQSPLLGEISTEVYGFWDLHIKQ